MKVWKYERRLRLFGRWKPVNASVVKSQFCNTEIFLLNTRKKLSKGIFEYRRSEITHKKPERIAVETPLLDTLQEDNNNEAL